MPAVETKAAKTTTRGPRDLSPKWDNVESMTGEQFTQYYHASMSFYNLNSSASELKPRVIDWMSRNEYTRAEIAQFKATKDWRCGLAMGSIAACLLRGMPATHEGFNQNRSTVEWLRKEIVKVCDEGAMDIEPVPVSSVTKTPVQVFNIQDRIREQAGQMSEEIDQAIDNWITDPENFDPKAFKVASLLRTKGAKAAQARFIKGFFQSGQSELAELSSGSADEQLREAYSHHPRKNIKKLIDFYAAIVSACDQIAAEAKTLKKPRAAKVKPAEDLVKKLKFKVSDDKLGVSSVPAVGIIGAQSALVLNARTRKIGYYIAKTSAGLSVKGATIVNYTEMSVQKTLRKPEAQIKEFKEQNTQKRLETWFAKTIKTTETPLNGRLGEDVLILKTYK